MGSEGEAAPGVTASLTLAPEAASVPQARRFVRDALRQIGRDDWAEAAELPTSEVVTNAVLHARTPITVQIVVHASSVQIEVRDENPTLPTAPGYDSEATTGRGLALLEALTDRFGVMPRTDGKVVWFQLGSGPAPQQDVKASPPAPPKASAAIDVRLIGMPTNLWLVSRQHHDALLRELALARAADAGGASELAAADRARNIVFSAVVHAVELARDTARLALPANHPAPMPDVPASLDLTLAVSDEDAPAFAALRHVVDAAQRLAEAGELLVRPALPEIVAVRHWTCQQVLDQLRGEPPRQWPGADAEEFVATRTTVPANWNLDEVTGASDCRIAVDDTNHILGLSQALAALVKWEAEDLVGRRVVALVPPRYREAHTAGYTRYLATGEAHALDVPLVLPVLTRDGREIDCTFYISAHTRAGQQMFTATINPIQDRPDEAPLGEPLDAPQQPAPPGAITPAPLRRFGHRRSA